MKSRFAVKPFSLLKKENREKHKFSTWQMYFVIYYYNQDMKQATKARMSRLHVVTVLNFPRATRTRRTGNVKLIQRKYLTKFISYLSLKRFSVCLTSTIWFTNEVVFSSVEKIASKRRNFRKVYITTGNKIKRTLTSNILTFLSLPGSVRR